jgi:hypothetical protein
MVNITNTGEALEDVTTDTATEDVTSTQAGTQESDTPESENGEGDEEVTETGNVTADELARNKSKFLVEVGKIGQQDGQGKKAILNFAETIVEGAMELAIVEKDAERFYKKFRDASDKKAQLDGGVTMAPAADAKSIKQQAAKMLPLIKLGHAFRDEDAKATDIVRRARNLHLQLMASPDEKKLLKLKSTYPAILSVAVAQLDEKKGFRGVPMTEDQMRSVMQGERRSRPARIMCWPHQSCRERSQGKAVSDDSEGREPIEHDGLVEGIQSLHAVLGDIDPDMLNKHLKSTRKDEVNEVVVAFKASYRLIPTRA